MRYIVFRFDVDTEPCIREGVPNLLKLASKHQVKFTFYINMGRAIHLVSSIYKDNSNHSTRALTARRKLGIYNFFRTALLNPNVGKNNIEIVKSIYENGHEVGLHGGRNHELWNKNFKKFSRKQIYDEVDWGINQLSGVCTPSGFSSPHWRGSRKLDSVLKDKGFLYSANVHGRNLKFRKGKKNFYNLPTNLLAEPGGVGYIENCFAKDMSSDEIVKKFKTDLMKAGKYAVIYDHPYFCGREAFDITEKLIIAAQDMGRNFVTMKGLINAK